jgi:hypothetical protein
VCADCGYCMRSETHSARLGLGYERDGKVRKGIPTELVPLAWLGRVSVGSPRLEVYTEEAEV